MGLAIDRLRLRGDRGYGEDCDYLHQPDHEP
jgi:hypothetical protein